MEEENLCRHTLLHKLVDVVVEVLVGQGQGEGDENIGSNNGILHIPQAVKSTRQDNTFAHQARAATKGEVSGGGKLVGTLLILLLVFALFLDAIGRDLLLFLVLLFLALRLVLMLGLVLAVGLILRLLALTRLGGGEGFGLGSHWIGARKVA